MSSWQQVREELYRLRAIEPNVLMGYTNPDTDVEPNGPFLIRLTPSSVSIAEDLHRRFGEEVSLRVGALPYPPQADEPWNQPSLREPIALDHALDGIQVSLDGPLAVKSGASVEHGLLITNKTSTGMTVDTNGQLTAQIVDLHDGSHVGGASGAQRMPLVRFEVGPGETTRIPLLVGTASYVPHLGYTIPPGRWGLTVDLDLFGRPTVRSPVLVFDILA
jgi:hypothetical protein